VIRKAIIVLSLVLATCSCALGVLSHWWAVSVTGPDCPFGLARIRVVRSRVSMVWTSAIEPPDSTFSVRPADQFDSVGEELRRRGIPATGPPWFSWGWRSFPGLGPLFLIWLPIWLIVLLCCLYPAILLLRGPLRRWRRRRKGLCLKCGYNLTGNTSGRCPECGDAV
jgi:hypothetical protein